MNLVEGRRLLFIHYSSQLASTTTTCSSNGKVLTTSKYICPQCTVSSTLYFLQSFLLWQDFSKSSDRRCFGTGFHKTDARVNRVSTPIERRLQQVEMKCSVHTSFCATSNRTRREESLIYNQSHAPEAEPSDGCSSYVTIYILFCVTFSWVAFNHLGTAETRFRTTWKTLWVVLDPLDMVFASYIASSFL